MSASANETPDMIRDTEYNKGLQEIQARVWPLRAVIGAMWDSGSNQNNNYFIK